MVRHITDDEIADIYKTKLKSIYLGRRNNIEQHKASANAIIRDPYSHFREVPNFSNNGSSFSNSNNNSDVIKHYELLKRIAGNNS